MTGRRGGSDVLRHRESTHAGTGKLGCARCALGVRPADPSTHLSSPLDRYAVTGVLLLRGSLTTQTLYGADRFRPDGCGGGGMQGTLTWPLKNVSKHQLPITVMSAVASASALRSQSPPNLGDVGTGLTPVKPWLKNRAGLLTPTLVRG